MRKTVRKFLCNYARKPGKFFTELRELINFLRQKGYTYNSRYSKLYDEEKRPKVSRNVLAYGGLLDREDLMKTLEAGLYVQDINL